MTPLYVDALPALATHALQRVAAARTPERTPALFSAVINCGFPEPEQTRTAMRIARHFSDAAGYCWAGGLPLGGGGVINPAVPLEQQQGPAEHVNRAVSAAVHALALGQSVPADALELMMQSPLPDAAYRLMGDLGWRYQAHKNGLTQGALRARPLDR